MKIIRRPGATSQILQIFIADSSSTTGAGLTGLAFNTASLTAYFHRDTDTTATAITLVTMTVGTFTSSGFKEVDATNQPGVYQFCPPNTALAAGAGSVIFLLKGATNMAQLPIEIDMDSQVDVYFWNGTVVATPATAGIPDVNAKNIGGTSQTGRDIGASVLLSSGTGTGQLDFTSGVVKANATQWLGGTIPAVNVTGVPKVDVLDWLGTTVSTPTVAGVPNVNAKTWNDLTTVALPLIPTTAGRTLDVSATGEAGIDWANVGSPTTTLALTGTTIAATQKVDVDTIKTNPVVNGGTITFPTTATLASTTNITAGTMTTTTNLTNAPTNGDFTAVMKTSLNAATPVVTLAAAAVQAIWDALTSALTTVGSIGKLLVTDIDATISSRTKPADTQAAVTLVATTTAVTNDVGITQAAADKVFSASGAAMAELSGVPSATPSPRNAMMLIFMTLRNKLTTTSSVKSIFNDAGSAITTKGLSDDSVTYTEDKMA